jgi:hypothetical protein
MRTRSGKESEDIIEKICTSMFFSDFIIRNPSFVKPNGKRIELSDLLIPFGDIIITIQVKSKYQSKKPNEKTPIDFQRLSDTIDDGVEQVKTIKRALNNNWLKGMKTARGFTIDVKPSDIKEVLGIVILDLVGEEFVGQDEKTQIFGSYTMRHNIPIHIYSASDFFSISKELDTITDFIRFLRISQELYSTRLVVIPSTLDLLALYKMEPDLLKKAIKDSTTILIEEGLWNSYLTDHAEAIKKREQLNEPSYIIDGIIDYLHNSVGYQPIKIDSRFEMYSGLGTVDGYITIAREIAILSRIERRLLGERLSRCLNRSMEKKEAYSTIYKAREKTGYLVLSKSGDRNERLLRLQLLTAILYCHLQLDKIIAIATEPMAGEGRSYDFISYSGVLFLNAKELSESAEKYFGKQYSATVSEYSND